MIADIFHPRHVLSSDDKRLPLPIIHDRAPELDDTIADNDIDEAGGRLGLLSPMRGVRRAATKIAIY
jgi:hypothetical protein